MDKVLGIVAEYNPFHNGHLYHLNKSKELTGANYTIAIISGNFTERGDTSLVDKWKKTKMALESGVDLVIELPVLYAISSAENFAEGAIKILNSLGIVDYISFGCESDNLENLDRIATVFNNEPKAFKKMLNDALSLGLSYPSARQNALSNFLNISLDELALPNNILAIEYLKALKKFNSNIEPILIKRFESGYNDTSFSNNIASATAIRKLIKNKDYDILHNLLPKKSYSILMDSINADDIVVDLSCFEKEIIYTFRKMTTHEISKLPDVSEGLENNIKNAVNSCCNIFELLEKIKSKRYTLTRLQRILLYALLGITKNDIEISKRTTPYVRVLGFNENGKKLVSKIKKTNPNLQIITSVKKFVDMNIDEDLKNLFDKDILATNIYTLACNNCVANLDFTIKI